MNGRGVRCRRVAGVGAVALTAAACSGEPAEPEWAGTVVDSAGVRIVHNPEEGLWCEGQRWTFTEALSIGSEDGDPAYQFGKVTDVAVAPEGTIFVLDQMAGEVRAFDADGRYLRTIGGQGQGPGEFSRATGGVFLTDDGRLTIPDLGNRRVSWMNADGSFAGSVAASLESGFPVRWDGDRSGGVVVHRRAMGNNQDALLEVGEPIVRIDPEGDEDTLVVMPRAETVWMEGAAPRFRYFATEPSWDLGPGGTLRTAMTQAYRIEVRDPAGTLRTVITKPAPPRPLTDEDQARFTRLLRDALERADVSPPSIDRQIDRLDFGETYPAFNRIMEGPDGATIVQRVAPLDEITTLDLTEEMSRRLGSTEWDVFGADGRYLGTIDLPARFSPMAWTSDAVYGRWMDDLDRSLVVKLAMERGAGGC